MLHEPIALDQAETVMPEAIAVPIKVLHVAQMLPGGVLSYLEELLPEQIARYGTANVLAIVPADQARYLASAEPHNLRTFGRARRSPLDLLKFAYRVVRVVREERPDVVHLHSTFAGALRPLICLFSASPRPKIVYCAHGWSFNMKKARWKQAVYALVERIFAPFGDSTICISDFEYRSARRWGLSGKGMVTIENAVASEPPIGPDIGVRAMDGKLNLLFIGRYDEQKGFDIAEAAMDQLLDAPVVLHAVGASVVAARGGTANTANTIHYGWQNRGAISQFIAMADALIMPSRWEGFGLAAIEAMRQGKPVLAARVDALPDVVSDGRTGLLFPPEDPVALATLVRELDKAELARLGAQAQQEFQVRFTGERLNREICALYAQLCNRQS